MHNAVELNPPVSDFVGKNVIKKMTDGVVIVDERGIIREVNPAIENIFGYKSTELLGQPAAKILPRSPQELLQSNDVLHRKNPRAPGNVYVLTGRRKDGAEFPMELTINEMQFDNSRLLTVIVHDTTETKLIEESFWSIHDELERLVEQRTAQLVQANQELEYKIEENKKIQEALKASEHRLRMVVTNAPVILFALDQTGVFTLSEGKGLERLGLAPGGLVGRSVYEIFAHNPDLSDSIQRAVEGEEISSVLELNDIIFECWYSVVRSEHGAVSGIIGVATDITERKRAEARLVQMANYDSLTGLPNRTLFRDRLNHAIAQARRKNRLVALLFLDLDRFKMVNDSLGHHAGDELLKGVAQRLLTNARQEDTVSRLGGDEFTVILEGLADVDDAATVARKILDVLSQPFYLDGHEVFVTTSVGITIYPHDGADIDTLLKNADTAMYQAKEHGRNNFQFYTADMNAKAVEHLIMESSMRHALERNEFLLHYQPQVDLHSREVTGLEALLRWQHPDLGLLYPNQFMPLAEETGLIISIGEWVLRQACAQAADWKNSGLPPMRMAVNLSAQQFRQKNLVDIVASALHDSGLDSKYLELEITESFLVDDVESAINTLRNLHALGLQLSIDDFGTGYSSLSYLKRFPLNSLKIDQSFVRDLSTDPDDAAIAEAIVALAQSLRLRVMAEGVETEEQLYFLRTRGCDQVQGFYISKPVIAEEIPAWCQAANANRLAFEQKALFKS